MYTEDELMPLSGLQHLSFCERRWALVHIESIWEENRFTAEGKLLHERAHSGDVESRPGVLVRRTLPVRSFRLGLSGQTDIVEFYPASAEQSGTRVAGKKGFWRPYPVEYKRSRDKAGSTAYRVQLCAQALCLEEMLHTEVSEGAVYDGTARHRELILFDASLRQHVEQLAARMHELRISGKTPKVGYEKKCDSCSLYSACLPKITADSSALKYLKRAIRTSLADDGNRP
jgi:CRISPR-associated exonuclease Cas4